MNGKNPLSEIIVVIPVHDEEELLGACLSSVAAAASNAAAPVRTIVVLDQCSDGSAAVAAGFPEVTTLTVSGPSVGAARAFGVAHALRSSRFDPQRVWLANTDADSLVSAAWIGEHERAAHEGMDAYVGAVVPMIADLDDARAHAWRTTHSPGSTLGHVHGANLGIRASAYRRAGGFRPLDVDEDVDLVRRLRAGGAVICESEDEPVITSSRLVGRARNGYAEYLSALVPGDART